MKKYMSMIDVTNNNNKGRFTDIILTNVMEGTQLEIEIFKLYSQYLTILIFYSIYILLVSLHRNVQKFSLELMGVQCVCPSKGQKRSLYIFF